MITYKRIHASSELENCAITIYATVFNYQLLAYDYSCITFSFSLVALKLWQRTKPIVCCMENVRAIWWSYTYHIKINLFKIEESSSYSSHEKAHKDPFRVCLCWLCQFLIQWFCKNVTDYFYNAFQECGRHILFIDCILGVEDIL